MTVTVSVYVPLEPVQPIASPQDVLPAVTTDRPTALAMYTAATVPQPPPGMQGRVPVTTGLPWAASTAVSEGDPNVQ